VSGRPFALNDPRRAAALSRVMHRLIPDDRAVRIVHICGTHEAAITEHGLRGLLPTGVQVVEGPGCPVCVTPTRDIDAALQLLDAGVTVCTYGDMLRVPGSRTTLAEARAAGQDVRTVLSAAEALSIARDISSEVVFFAVGFETTAPMTAALLTEDSPPNLSLLVSHKLIPPAMAALLQMPGTDVDGYLAPGHVATIIGLGPFARLPGGSAVPIVVGGFEPLDILYAVALLLRQIASGVARVENGYPRAVDPEGNPAAQRLTDRAFTPCDARWRGIGIIPRSGLALRPAWADRDARQRFGIEGDSGEEIIPGCRCAEILTARALPDECPLFATACTPTSPLGPCMVGSEGACSIWFRYGGRPIL
jgi:hydrogenase expression/formation protein HypD